MKGRSSGQFLLGVLVIAGVLLASAASGGLFDGADAAILALQYHLRGESRPDSSVMVIYFNGDDIAALGGLPLKRSYYALLVNALNNLGAGVIGIDIAFTEQDKEHPEYDRLLAQEVRRCDRVVLSGYFHSIGAAADTAASGIPSRFTCSLPDSGRFPAAGGPDLPLSDILAGAAGFGHTNLDDGLNIPAFLRSGRTLVPCFAIEVLRHWLRADVSQVSVRNGDVRMNGPEKHIVIPIDRDGAIRANYSGGTGALNTVSAVRFLQAYDTSLPAADPLSTSPGSGAPSPWSGSSPRAEAPS